MTGKINQPSPLVSVIIPAYNTSAYISEALDSVFRQSYKNFEIIVIDDGSTDDTADIVKKSLGRNNVQYTYQENKGPSAARNVGIRHSKGEFIAFLDGDDYWEPSKLEKQMQIFKTTPEVDVVYCKFHKVDCAGNPLHDSPQPLPPPTDLYKALLFGNIIYGSCSAIVVRANVMREIMGFDEELFIGEDLELWQRLAYRNKFHCIDEYLVYIRTHAESAQANREHFERGQLLFLNKLKTNILPKYNNLWAQTAYRNYINFGQAYFRENNYKKTFKFVRLILRLGIKYTLRFLVTMTEEFMKKVFTGFKRIVRNILYSQKNLKEFYLSQRLRHKLADWRSRGNPLPVPPEVKQQIVSGFQKKYQIKIFVETGTFFGDMVEAARRDFKQNYSVELGTDLYINATHRFSGVKNVLILQGDSGKVLLELMPNLREPCLFWLDAHYSEGITARGDKETPVVEELEAISRHSFKAEDIILIDDASGFGRGDHPPLDWVKDWAEKQGFDSFEVDFDIIQIYNKR